MARYVCIHGHFYQPPRENPWLEDVELQDSAYPYHDWNERITAECYAPNTASRILDSNKKIINIINNYSKINFNFGPTLLSWLEKNTPDIYKSIIAADKESQKIFSGHGSAIAQCYNHMIMSLANSRDKRTQVIWGIRDFEYRFNRKPEGMWLPEAAVDIETLELLAEYGIKYTLLSPNQAKCVRKINDESWNDVTGSKIDPKISYLCCLPSGKSISIFFYDGLLSREVAFGNLLENGEILAKRLINTLNNSTENQLAHIAVDGETFGHHHNYGDMALAYCLHHIERNKLANITIYGEYLKNNPPGYEVRIIENTSWSCAHGVERWRNNCGCNSGMHPGWNQNWRAVLRSSFDWLRDILITFYEETISAYFSDPWLARDEYIDVILKRTNIQLEDFFSKYTINKLTKEEKIKVFNLLEMQRYSMLMYTSCGWFFDEISGIETVQVLQYAARVIQLAKLIGGLSLEEAFINLLKHAQSNITEFKNGAQVYRMFVKPAISDFLRVGAHYAISSLFEEYTATTKIYSYTANSEFFDKTLLGKQKLAIGKMRLLYDMTSEEHLISFAVLHLGDQNLIGGVREFHGDEHFSIMYQEINDAFKKNDVSRVIILIDKYFGSHSYSVWHLFREEQRKILSLIFRSTLSEFESAFRGIKATHYTIMQTMKDLHMPFPKAFTAVVEFIIDSDIIKLLENDDYDHEKIKRLIEEAKKWGAGIDKKKIGLMVTKKINILFENILMKPCEISLFERINNILAILDFLPLELNLWEPQNTLFQMSKHIYPEMVKKASNGDNNAEMWIEYFNKCSQYLKVRTE